MISFPFAKINLGLNILKKRADGYHELETCFYPVKGLYDALEMIPSTTQSSNLTAFNSDWEGPKEENLVWKAYQMFLEFVPKMEPMDWFLYKKIPSGGGLGGGSSDAVFALRLMAEKCEWSRNDPRLLQMANQLGSDCAFFLFDTPMLGIGRGEKLETAKLSQEKFRIEIVFPGTHISTKEAFENIKPSFPTKSISEILKQPIHSWKDDLKNDFEDSIFPKYPELAKIKEELYKKGALYASMSGSGSTMYGLFSA